MESLCVCELPGGSSDHPVTWIPPIGFFRRLPNGGYEQLKNWDEPLSTPWRIKIEQQKWRFGSDISDDLSFAIG